MPTPDMSLTDALHAQRMHILAEWEQEVRRLPKAASLPALLLIDQLPGLLDEIATAVGGGATGVPAASQHAIERLGSGFDLAEVIQEYGILRCVLVRAIGRTHVSVSMEQFELIHGLIDDAMARAVAFYTEAARRAFAAINDVSVASSEEVRVPELLEPLLRAVVDAVPAAQAAAILVLGGSQARIRASIGLEGVNGVFDAADAWRASGDAIRAAGFQNVWSLPLRRDEHQVGVAHIASRTASEFSDEQTMLFSSMAARAADLVTHSQLLARERAATLATRALSTAGSWDEAVSNLLAAIGSSFGWDVAAFWTRASGDDVLRRTHGWSASGVTSHSETASRELALARGEGLPGRAWQSGTVVWSGDLAAETDVPRLSGAVEDGLRSAVIFPILDGAAVIGVFEFFSRERRARTDEAVEGTETVAQHLPDFLLRLDAQEQVRRREAEMAAVQQAALDAIISMDGAGRITGWNPASERMFGYSAREATGRELAELIVPEGARAAHRRGLGRYLATGEQRYFDRRLEMAALRRDGTEFPVELVITRVGTGAPLFTGYVRDISARVHADEQRDRLYREAQQASRTREQVLAIVSHDLRNPLNAITAAASLLLKGAGGGLNETTVRRAAEATLRSVDRMNRLIADLLDIASIQAGRLSVERHEQQIETLLTEAVDPHRSHASDRGIELSVHIDADVPACCVDVDGHRILQVMSNLIGNAVKFCASGAAIEVRASRDANEIHVAVADTGPGIPHDELPNLFDPYWTGRQGRTLGTGLGLFISKGIVEAHGGRLWAQSEPGRGSTFTFSVPLASGV